MLLEISRIFQEICYIVFFFYFVRMLCVFNTLKHAFTVLHTVHLSLFHYKEHSIIHFILYILNS